MGVIKKFMKTITKEFQFDMAHRLYDPTLTTIQNAEVFGKCFNIHGHTYKLFVTVEGSLKNGMIINFVDLKRIINEKIIDKFDHKILLTRKDPLLTDLYNHAVIMDKPSTCENQIDVIWDLVESQLAQLGILLKKIKLYETPTSFCTRTA